MLILPRCITYRKYLKIKGAARKRRLRRMELERNRAERNHIRAALAGRPDVAVARAAFTCSAHRAVTIHIIFKQDELISGSAQRSFKPVLVHQVFNEEGKIFGYRNLTIDIYFLANSFKCYVALNHSEVFRIPHGPPPDDIMQTLSQWLPNRYMTTRESFLEAISLENNSKRYGKVLTTFGAHNASENHTYKYFVTKCDIRQPGFAQFHSRFECSIVWSIDAASQIDLTDPHWMFFYIYEQRESISGRKHYFPVGYCTVYNFFHFPDKVRCRISQFYIMPPCQRYGLGIRFLRAIYRAIHDIPNVIDITVEDPARGFTCMRDLLDCQLVMQLDMFKPPSVNGPFINEMYLEANDHFKLCKRQTRRVYEIIRLSMALREDTMDVDAPLDRFRDDLKARISAPYLREQRAIGRKGSIKSAGGTSLAYQPSSARYDIAETVDEYFSMLHDFAVYLNDQKLPLKLDLD